MKKIWTPDQISKLVGELVLTASALDHQLTHICIAVFRLAPSGMLIPVVGSLDISRKLDTLKAFIKHWKHSEWRDLLTAHIKTVEKLNQARNIAAHSVLMLKVNSECVLVMPAAAKLLKSIIDPHKRLSKPVDINQLFSTCKEGQEAVKLWEGSLLAKLKAAFPPEQSS